MVIHLMPALRSAVTRLWPWLLWGTLIGLVLLVVVAVFIPLFGFHSGYYPSPPPGFSATQPYEFAGMARYRGTLWADPFWADLFWSVGCNGLCWWLPVFLTACIVTRRQWASLSLLARRLRLAVLLAGGGATVLWLLAGMILLGETLD